MLHNFGQRTGIYGALQNIAVGPAVAFAQAPKNMVGMGLTPEGIETYDFKSALQICFNTN